MAKANLTIDANANVQKAVTGLQHVSKQLEDMQKEAQKSKEKFKGLATAAAAVFAALKIGTDVVRGLTDAYKEQAAAEASLVGVWKSTKNAVGMSVSELKKLAQSYEKVTLFTDEAIMSAEQVFMITKNIGSDVMPRATMAALDMASAGEDLGSSADKLAKVLASPIEELESLKESNIILDESTKAYIKRLAEENRMLEAQTAILDEVEKRYGGLAKAVADVPTATLDKIGNTMDSIKENLGAGLLNSIQPALDTLYGTLLKIEKWSGKYGSGTSVENAIYAGKSLEIFSDEELDEAIDYITSPFRNMHGLPMSVEKEMELLSPIYSELGSRRKKEELDARIAADKKDIAAHVNASGAAASDARRVAEWALSGPALDAYVLDPNDAKFKKDSTLAQTRRAKAEVAKILAATDAAITAEMEKQAVLRGDFIGQYSGLSETSERLRLEQEITKAVDLRSGAADGSDEAKILDEIIEKLNEELNLQQEISKEEEKQVKTLQDKVDEAHIYTSAVQNLISQSFGLAGQLMQKDIDNTEKSLEEKKALYDEYFDYIDGKYAKEQEGLDRYYATGLMSAEDYAANTERLTEEETAAKKAAQDDIEKTEKEADNLKERQFNVKKANDITQATINGAMAITDIWAKNGANPVMAGILTGISSAALAVQIATISSQKYQPMAAGGIVSSPTHALIGEAGPEAIVPLNQFNLERKGLTEKRGGSLSVIVNVENNYSSDDLSESVYRGIERAQREGVLPGWSYIA